MQDQIDAFLSYLQIECGLSRNTILAYGRDLRGLEGPLTRKSIQDFMTRRRAGRRPSSQARGSAALRSFLKFIGRPELAQWVLAPKKPRLLPHPIAERQLDELLEADTGDRLSIRDRAILELFYASDL